MTTESDHGNCRSAANLRNVADAAQGNKDELRQIIMGTDELRETLCASLDHVVLCTNAAMRSATEVLT